MYTSKSNVYQNFANVFDLRIFLETIALLKSHRIYLILHNCPFRDKMATSKHQLAGALEKKTLTLEGEIKYLDYAEANQKLGCRKLAEVFNIGKTASANILKNKKKIREQYEQFHEKNKGCSRPGKYKLINDILYDWYQKCCSSGLYLNGPLLKEEAMEIKEQLQDSEFDGFVASDGWLDKWKASYAIKRGEL